MCKRTVLMLQLVTFSIGDLNINGTVPALNDTLVCYPYRKRSDRIQDETFEKGKRKACWKKQRI